MTRWGFAGAALVLTVSACGSIKTAEHDEAMALYHEVVRTRVQTARSLVLSRLRDPESAQFRNFVEASRLEKDLHLGKEHGPDIPRQIICGEVNAKNALGGYVGFRPFAVVIGFYDRYHDAELRLTPDYDRLFEGQSEADAVVLKLTCQLDRNSKPVPDELIGGAPA